MADLLKLRLVLGGFMIALVLSGVTAFPLQHELDWLAAMVNPDGSTHSGLGFWILTVRDGLRETYAKYPWIAYGTDWLAFAHIVIALFFIGPLVDPVRNVWVLKAGMMACVLVIALAMICGPIRQIPPGWRLIDCSFGVFGIVPLYYCLRVARRMEKTVNPDK